MDESVLKARRVILLFQSHFISRACVYLKHYIHVQLKFSLLLLRMCLHRAWPPTPVWAICLLMLPQWCHYVSVAMELALPRGTERRRHGARVSVWMMRVTYKHWKIVCLPQLLSVSDTYTKRWKCWTSSRDPQTSLQKIHMEAGDEEWELNETSLFFLWFC